MFIGGDVSEDLKLVIEDATKRLEADGIQLGPLQDVEVEIWKQTWGSTALGFGGIGGCAISSAYTFLAWSPYRQSCYVYFAGRFAYKVSKPNENFRQAYIERKMPKVRDAQELSDE